MRKISEMTLTPYDKEYQDCKEQFLETFNRYVEEFYEIQLKKFTRKTAQNYSRIAGAWIEYIYGYTDCLTFKDISVAQTNSYFFTRTRHEGLGDFDSKEVKSKLRVFVEFLREKGYENPNVDKALSKK